MGTVVWIIYLFFITSAGVQFMTKFENYPWPTEAICLARAAELHAFAETRLVVPTGGTIHTICRPQTMKQDMVGNG